MDRRSFLRGLAALGAAGALAGCANDGEAPPTARPPPPPVQTAASGADDAAGGGDGGGGDSSGDAESANGIVLAGQNVVEADDGGLVIVFTVRNEGTNSATALVEAVVAGEGEGVTLNQFVELIPGESTTVRLRPDISYDDYTGHVPRIRARTPATPLPSDTPTPDDGTPGGAGSSDETASTGDGTPGGTGSSGETASTGDGTSST